MKFRPRYWVVLLWHWAPPFALGFVSAYCVFALQVVEMAPALEAAFVSAISGVCK